MAYSIQTRRGLGAYRPRSVSPRRRLRGFGALSQASTLTPQDAVQQALANAGNVNLNPNLTQNPTVLAKWASQVQAGQFDTSWVSPSCVGIIAANPTEDLSLTQAVGSIAGATTGAFATAAGGTPAAIAAGTATATGVALGAATLGIGVVVAVLSMIFAHHAAAVKQEQQIECTATAAANNAMNAIAQGVSSGQIAPADAATALSTLYSEYQKMVAPSWGTSPWCNANCELQILMNAMVIYWQAQYQAMADQAAAAAASNPVAAAAASTGLPLWALYAAGAFLLYELVS